MPEHPNSTIVSAIESRRVLSLVYGGKPIDFEPYTYGRMKAGREFLFGWQRTGLFGSWRVLFPDRARSLRLTEATFDAPRAGYNAVLSDVSEVFAQVEPDEVLHS